MKLLFSFTLFVFSFFAFGQDAEFLKIKKYQISTLNDSLKETSGLGFFKDQLFSFNDSGNSSEIFQIDIPSGKILKTIQIPSPNFDWEAIANDGNQIFIGDFGNNVGIRKDLKIYKIKLDSAQEKEVTAIDSIQFYYPEQKSFKKNNRNHDFDAESMIYLNEKLHLFTKEWVSRETQHYLIDPKLKGDQPAEKLESYDVGFLVTDASYFDHKLYLIGYTKKFEVYLSIFEESENGLFFTKKPKKFYLGLATTIGQIEGIAVNENGIYISGEEFRYAIFNVPASLYFISNEEIKGL